jgi:hypothetical protein
MPGRVLPGSAFLLDLALTSRSQVAVTGTHELGVGESQLNVVDGETEYPRESLRHQGAYLSSAVLPRLLLPTEHAARVEQPRGIRRDVALVDLEHETCRRSRSCQPPVARTVRRRVGNSLRAPPPPSRRRSLRTRGPARAARSACASRPYAGADLTCPPRPLTVESDARRSSPALQDATASTRMEQFGHDRAGACSRGRRTRSHLRFAA